MDNKRHALDNKMTNAEINSNDWQTTEEATDNPYKTCQLISDIAHGYDGFNTVESLKGLIDELKSYADLCLKKARERGDIE